MAKRTLTPEQKEARRERARKRRAAKKGIPYVPAVKTNPEVLKQITYASTEEDILALPKKSRKAKAEKTSSRKTRKSKEQELPKSSDISLYSSMDSMKQHRFHRFADNDDFKSVYYMTRTRMGSNLLRGLFCKIDKEGRIDPSEYKKLEAAQKEPGFLGFVKEHEAK